MKNFKVVALTLVAVLFLSGCGQAKTLKCDGKMEGMETNITSDFDAKGKFTKADMTMHFDVTKDMLKVMPLDKLKDTLKEQLETTMKGVEINVSDNGTDRISITMTFDEKTIKEISGSDKVETYNQLKKSLEDQKFTCK